MNRKRIGIILAGSGVQDGSEIHEAVLAMLALDRAGVEIVCMAPDRDQTDVVDHRTGESRGERRNVLVEAARIARGKIQDVRQVEADDLDGVVLPGGYGAAKNLCTFATEGASCTVVPAVAELLQELHRAGKPIAALCIAPAILAAVFGSSLHPEITIGNDSGTARALEQMGARHRDTPVTDIVVDEANRIVTTPCYMYDARIAEVATGIDKAVQALLRLAAERAPARA